MGSPNCMLDGMCGADLKYPNESFSPKHGGMFADPRGNIILLFHLLTFIKITRYRLYKYTNCPIICTNNYYFLVFCKRILIPRIKQFFYILLAILEKSTTKMNFTIVSIKMSHITNMY